MREIRVIVLDDHEAVCKLLEEFLTRHSPQAKVEVCNTGEELRKRLEEAPFDLLISDLYIGDESGAELVAEVCSSYPEMTVIVISATQDIGDAVTMFRLGVYDFVIKPIEFEYLGAAMDRAMERLALTDENSKLRLQTQRTAHLPDMVGSSADMIEVAQRVRRIAQRDTTVMIRGESGTGKELVARAIHHLSLRSEGPFVAFNIAAVPETLLEAECFGYAKNSGVSGSPPEGRAGLFEMANGGTLFLDEVGDMPLTAQAKILRVIQEREVYRIGANTPIKIDIRLVSATHKELERAVEEREFREDLFFRLNSFSVFVPPLRTRVEDIPALAQYFLDRIARDEGEDKQRVLSSDAAELLKRYPWKGNARELRSLMERVAIANGADTVRATDITAELAASQPRELHGDGEPTSKNRFVKFKEACEDFEHEYLRDLLQDTYWNVSHSAERAGVSRTYLHRLLRKHGLKRPH